MNVTSTQLAVPPMHSFDVVGRCLPTSESPPPAALLLYGEERANAALADELTLDGYEVRRASDPARLRAACDACEVELVIFGRATRRGAGLGDALSFPGDAVLPLGLGALALWHR